MEGSHHIIGITSKSTALTDSHVDIFFKSFHRDQKSNLIKHITLCLHFPGHGGKTAVVIFFPLEKKN